MRKLVISLLVVPALLGWLFDALQEEALTVAIAQTQGSAAQDPQAAMDEAKAVAAFEALLH